jgi:hypothetical protein
MSFAPNSELILNEPFTGEALHVFFPKLNPTPMELAKRPLK